jgi:hypothetical protein
MVMLHAYTVVRVSGLCWNSGELCLLHAVFCIGTLQNNVLDTVPMAVNDTASHCSETWEAMVQHEVTLQGPRWKTVLTCCGIFLLSIMSPRANATRTSSSEMQGSGVLMHCIAKDRSVWKNSWANKLKAISMIDSSAHCPRERHEQ